MEEIKSKKIDPETKKKYNDKYYSTHKEELMKKALSKTECPLCNKMVAYCNLKRHQKTINCMSKQEKITQDNDVVEE